MPQERPLLVAILAVAALTVVPATVSAQPARTFTLGLQGSIGGFTDAEPDTGFDNLGLQAFFFMEIDHATLFGVRLGQLQLEADDAFGDLYDSDLSYLTLAGEYRFPEAFYESGLYLGLGFYSLDGGPVIEDDTGLGLNLGATGTFRLTDRLSLVVDLSAHYADLDRAQFLFMGNVGLGFSF